MLYLPQTLNIEVLGLNFTSLRIIILLIWIKIIFNSSDIYGLEFNELDLLVFATYLYYSSIMLIAGNSSIAYAIGVIFDTFSCYIFFRLIINNHKDMYNVFVAFLPFITGYLILVSFEHFFGNNLFKLIGWEGKQFIREGNYRCFGSFRHPTLLGTFGASYFPIYMCLFLSKANRLVGLFGAIICVIIVFYSNSGGPIISLTVGLLGSLLFFQRKNIKLYFGTAILLFLFLIIFMEAPIWYLPYKIGSLTGGYAWHRSYLIDVALKNIDEWWLFGMNIEKTKDWFYYVVEATGGADITNQYLLFGLRSGIISTILLLFLLYKSAIELAKNILNNINSICSDSDKLKSSIEWALFVTLFVHIVTWFGITYFDQSIVNFLFTLSLISSIVSINRIGTRKKIFAIYFAMQSLEKSHLLRIPKDR